MPVPIFYERTESPDKVRIVFKYTMVYHLSLIIALAGLILAHQIFNDFCCTSTVMLIAIIPLLIYYADTREAYSEYSRARKEGRASVSGRRWSFSNPLTVEIKKTAP